MKNSLTLSRAFDLISGIVNAKTLENVKAAFSSVYELQYAVQHDTEQLIAIKGIGPKLRDKIVAALFDQFVSPMNFHLTHYDFASEQVHNELHGSNAAFRWAVDNGLDPEVEFVYVDSLLKRNDDNAHIKWLNAINKGIVINDRLYKPLCTTASGAKKAQSIWCIAEHVAMFGRAFRKNFTLNNATMEPAKFFTRLGLFFSTSNPIEDVYSNFRLDASKVALGKDVYRNGVNVTDGFAMVDGGSEAFQLRPEKLCVIPVSFKKLIKLIGDADIELVYGGTRKLSPTAFVMHASGHKWASICKSEEEFNNSLEDFGWHIVHTFKGKDIKSKGVVYQALQTLPLSDDELTKLEDHSAAYLDNMKTIEGFIGLLPKEMREAVAMYPAIAEDPFTLEVAQRAYNKQRMTLRGGAIPHVGGFRVICCDYVDVYSNGRIHLNAGECCIKSLPAGPVLFIRYPHTSEASWVILNNRPDYENAILDQNVLMLNNYDDTLRRLGGADFDGDKVLVFTNEEVKDVLMGCINNMGETHMQPALEGKAKKAVFTAKTAEDIKLNYFAGLTTMSQIGSMSNRLSAAYAALFAATTDEDKAKYRAFVTYYQLMVEMVVDREKHGNTYLKKPEGLDDFEGRMPKFIQFAKLAKKMGRDEKRVIPHPEQYTRIECPMEKYSEWIDANTTRSSDFCVDVPTFSYRNLMFDGDLVPISERWFKRSEKVTDANGNVSYVGGGVFDKIVFAKGDELREYADKVSVLGDTVRDIKTALMAWFLKEYASKAGCTEKDVYNLIVYYVFNMSNVAATKTYKQIFWDTLHGWAEEALVERFGESAISVDLGAIDDLDDDDDEALGI